MNKLGNICFIIDSDSIDNALFPALEAGINWIQYREKKRTRKEIFYNALKIREITKRFNACFIINDYTDIALAVDADGVHLGQDDLPIKLARELIGNKIIGISTHNIEEAKIAEKNGADYIGFGSIFPTTTKDDAVIQGIKPLIEVKKAVKIPIIAIGGITADNAKAIFEMGCYGIAVSSGILKGDIRYNVKRLLSIIDNVRRFQSIINNAI